MYLNYKEILNRKQPINTQTLAKFIHLNAFIRISLSNPTMIIITKEKLIINGGKLLQVFKI